MTPDLSALQARGYRISDQRDDVDAEVVYRYLSDESYWAKGISRALVERSIAHSMCFVVLQGSVQIGFARVITDHTTFAYLADVFILPAHRGQGLSRWLSETIVAHPTLQGLRRWLLGTRDAHTLYARVGFTPLKAPERFMELHRPDVYATSVTP